MFGTYCTGNQTIQLSSCGTSIYRDDRFCQTFSNRNIYTNKSLIFILSIINFLLWKVRYFNCKMHSSSVGLNDHEWRVLQIANVVDAHAATLTKRTERDAFFLNTQSIVQLVQR